MIHKLEMKHFGAFHDTDVDFKEGYQCLQGPNESGKSTTVMCIRALLYGFSKDSLHRKLYTDHYDDYFPLRGGEFSAAMELSTGRGHYRIERNFRKENERLAVIDLDHNKMIEDEALYAFSGIAQPGSLFWGLSQEDFLRFFCMSDLQAIDAVSIVKRIDEAKNFLMQGNSALSFPGAYAYLEKKKREIGTKRAKKSPMGRNSEKIESLEMQIAELRSEIRRLEEDTAKRETYATNLRQLKRRRDLQIEKKHVLPELRQRVEEVERLDRALQANEEAIDRFEAKQRRRPIASKRIHRVFAFLTAASAVATLAAMASFTEFFLLGAGAFILFGFATIVTYLSNRRIKNLMRRYHGWYVERDELLANKHRLYAWLDERMEEDFSIDQLQTAMAYYAKTLENLPEESVPLEEAIEKNQRRLGALEGKMREIETYEAALRDLMKEHGRETEKKERLNRDLAVVEMTESILREVDSTGRSDFQRKIIEDAESYLFELSEGRYRSIALGEGHLVVSGENRPSLKDSQLSESTADLLVLSLRLAAVKRMDPSIPMIFDDGFASMDGARRRRLVEILKTLDRQILDFTTPLRKGE